MKFLVYFFAFPFYIVKIVAMLAAGLLLLPLYMFTMLVGGLDADEGAETIGNWLKIMFKYPGT